MLARAGSQVDHIIGSQHNVLVVLDDQNRIANVGQFAQRFDQALVVALVQANARFVENVGNARELRADLRCQANALTLATRERARRTIQAQIIQPDVQQKAYP